MFANRIDLFRIFGIRVSLDLSWFLIAAFLAWSLANGYFPWAAPGLAVSTYWWMGILGTIGLFASIVVHEFAHALVARRYDMPISGITLFLFGGVAEMGDEPPTPRAEFWMAIAGPIASFVIAALLYLVYAASNSPGTPGIMPFAATVGYLAAINLAVAVFNLLPAFPLDGGRVLRSLLWWWKGDLHWASRIAAGSGMVLAILLIAFGVMNTLFGAFVSGIWQMLLGFFLYNAAGATQASTELRRELSGVRVSRVMNRDVVAVDAGASVTELVEEYFFRHHDKSFPVVDNNRLIGCVRLRDVNELDREVWPRTKVRDIHHPTSEMNVISPETPVFEAFTRMRESGDGRMLVASGDHLEGVVTADDVMSYVWVRSQLRGGNDARPAPPARHAPDQHFADERPTGANHRA
ncbi:MAG: site-2 protease family protein [Hyphomicrobiaceae bacterium]